MPRQLPFAVAEHHTILLVWERSTRVDQLLGALRFGRQRLQRHRFVLCHRLAGLGWCDCQHRCHDPATNKQRPLHSLAQPLPQ